LIKFVDPSLCQASYFIADGSCTNLGRSQLLLLANAVAGDECANAPNRNDENAYVLPVTSANKPFSRRSSAAS